MSNNKGVCHCGKVSFTLELADELESYAPRQCDCTFCLERNILYLSESGSTLEVKSSEPLIVIKQGSNQASFLSCSRCHSVIAASYKFGSQLKGSVNAALLIDFGHLQNAKNVSPKLLAPEQKLQRWQRLWLNVSIINV